jgi:hypothetical protein
MAQKQLEILECKAVFTGTNANGKPYTIHEVLARDPAKGTIIQLPLRSFDLLPLGVGTYEVETYQKPGKEKTYTLKKPGGGGGGGGGAALAGRVALLEEAVEQLKQNIAALRAERQPVLPGGGFDPGPEPPGSDPFGGDDDIPF